MLQLLFVDTKRLHVWCVMAGQAGWREGVTGRASVEVGVDSRHYGASLQLSNPLLPRRQVWSTLASLTTPQAGEEEVIRALLSIIEEEDEEEEEVVRQRGGYGGAFKSEFLFKTSGLATRYLDLGVSGKERFHCVMIAGSQVYYVILHHQYFLSPCLCVSLVL